MRDFKLALIALNKMRPFSSSQLQTRLGVAEKTPMFFFKTAAVLFVMLLSLAGWHTFIHPLSSCFQNLALVVAMLTIAFEMIFLFTMAIFGVIEILGFKKQIFSWLLHEADTDNENAVALQFFDLKVLSDVKYWLTVKCNRIEGRVKLFFGKPEMLAAPAILTFALAAHELLKKQPNGLFSGSFSTWVLYAVAGIGGIAIGAVMQNILRQKYCYQLEVLELAIRIKRNLPENSLRDVEP